MCPGRRRKESRGQRAAGFSLKVKGRQQGGRSRRSPAPTAPTQMTISPLVLPQTQQVSHYSLKLPTQQKVVRGNKRTQPLLRLDLLAGHVERVGYGVGVGQVEPPEHLPRLVIPQARCRTVHNYYELDPCVGHIAKHLHDFGRRLLRISCTF